MDNNKTLMILERSGENLTINRENSDYVLEGVFAQFGVENNNNRIYEEKEYLPHLDYLKKKISKNSLLGELDHPEKFDVSLSKVSHLIEDIKYDAKKRQIVGRIRLLDTPSGQTAKNLIDGGIPLSISSRSAGVVKENKKVEIKKIFTYDLVADPGFENAQLSKINESYGFSNDDDSIAIYDMGNLKFEKEDFNIYTNSKENKSKNMDKNYVSQAELNEYSLVIKEEIEKINDKISKLSESSDRNSLKKDVENLKAYANYLAENQKNMIGFSDYLAENQKKLVGYSDYLSGMQNKTIKYAEHIAEDTSKTFENVIRHNDYIAEQLNNSIQYSESIAEGANKIIKYADYLKEQLNNSINYSEHITENMENIVNYTEHIAESAASKTDFKQLTEYTEYMFENNGQPQSKPKNGGGNGVKNRYSSLDDKIESVLESVKKQKTEMLSEDSRYPFLKFLGKDKQFEFHSLNEAEKQRVVNSLNREPSFDSEQICKVWEKSLKEVEVNEEWLTNMPAEYIQLWESASPEVKAHITKQSKVYNLSTPYQIATFWHTRGLGNPSETVEVQKLNESQRAEQVKISTSLGYSVSDIAEIGEALKRYKV